MDFPKSVPGVGLFDGKFVDENQATGQVGSLIPSVWGNAVTEEILGLMAAGDEAPIEGDNDQLAKAVAKMIAVAMPDPVVKSYSANNSFTSAEMGLLLLDSSGGPRTFTLPPASAALGVVDVIVRRTDNSGNRLVVQASGADRIKFHTHLNAAGYGFLVLMGAGDWWHLRSDGAGGWWPIARRDDTPLGRLSFETTTAVQPGGYGLPHGVLFVRAEWPWVWDHAQASGMLVDDAGRAGFEGCWTRGDGATTVRSPDIRAEFLRVADEGRGVDTARTAGTWQKGTMVGADTTGSGDGFVVIGLGANTPTPLANFGVDPITLSNYPSQLAVIGGASATSPSSVITGSSRPRNIAAPARIKLI